MNKKTVADNGKIRVSQYKKSVICEPYTSDEITLADIEWFQNVLQTKFKPPLFVIVIKSGDYSISSEAQIRLLEGNGQIEKVVFVVDGQRLARYANTARGTYLKKMDVAVSDNLESAYEILTGTP